MISACKDDDFEGLTFMFVGNCALCNYADNFSTSLIFWACPPVLVVQECLRSRVDPNYQDKNGNTALMAAG